MSGNLNSGTARLGRSVRRSRGEPCDRPDILPGTGPSQPSNGSLSTLCHHLPSFRDNLRMASWTRDSMQRFNVGFNRSTIGMIIINNKSLKDNLFDKYLTKFSISFILDIQIIFPLNLFMILCLASFSIFSFKVE